MPSPDQSYTGNLAAHMYIHGQIQTHVPISMSISTEQKDFIAHFLMAY